jgi:dTDP-4-dehydrorhamnose reductase
MKILLTGKNGQVGSEVLRRAKPETLIALGRADLDITDRLDVADALSRYKPTVVINAAAFTAVDRAEQESQAAFAANRDGPAYLAEACANLGVPLIHLSTDYVFSGDKAGAYVEADPASPLGVYGQSKWEGEEAVRRYQPEHIILRVSWVFASHGGNFVKTMLRLGREREELRVVADQHGCPTYAGDIADAVLELAERIALRQALPWGTYHYTGVPSVSWHAFALAIFDVAKNAALIDRIPHVAPIATSEYPTPARRPENSVLNSDQAKLQLGLTQRPWRSGLAAVVESLKHPLS